MKQWIDDDDEDLTMWCLWSKKESTRCKDPETEWTILWWNSTNLIVIIIKLQKIDDWDTPYMQFWSRYLDENLGKWLTRKNWKDSINASYKREAFQQSVCPFSVWHFSSLSIVSHCLSDFSSLSVCPASVCPVYSLYYVQSLCQRCMYVREYIFVCIRTC